MDIQTILKGLEKPGKSRKGLADHMGWWPSTVTSLLDGGRKISVEEAPRIEAYLEMEPTIPIVADYIVDNTSHKL